MTVEALTGLQAHGARVEERLGNIEQKQAEFVAALTDSGDEGRTHFTPAEFAQKAGRKERTVRAWCREGRIKAIKRPSGRGKAGEWMIPREEYVRWLNEGLLKPKK
jgi:hypothetical protein